MEEYVLRGKGDVLARGRAVGIRVAAGRARFAKDPRQLHAFRDGEVLVADTATPDWEAVMKRAAAIVTNRGERTCHAAIRIPAVVGAENATEAVADGAETTVSCAEGDTGLVYAGRVPFEVRRTDLGTPPGRGRPSSLDNGRGGARARTGLARGLRLVRDPIERHFDRPVR